MIRKTTSFQRSKTYLAYLFLIFWVSGLVFMAVSVYNSNSASTGDFVAGKIGRPSNIWMNQTRINLEKSFQRKKIVRKDTVQTGQNINLKESLKKAVVEKLVNRVTAQVELEKVVDEWMVNNVNVEVILTRWLEKHPSEGWQDDHTTSIWLESEMETRQKPLLCVNLTGYQEICYDDAAWAGADNCMVRVMTLQTTCASYCREQGRVCIKSSDNLEDTCKRDLTSAEDCFGTWYDQICVCGSAELRVLPSYRDKVVLQDPMWGTANVTLILKRLRYWKSGRDTHRKPHMEPRSDRGKYLTFLKDCAGFNNVRLGLEYSIMLAWILNRTLVIPPAIGWYMLDWGKMTRMQPTKWGGKTHMKEFFDFEDIKKLIPVISTRKFISKLRDELEIPEKFHGKTFDPKKWELYLNKLGKDRDANLEWGPGGHILAVPDVSTVIKACNEKRWCVDSAFRVSREWVEYTEDQKRQLFLHLPSCYNTSDPNPVWSHYIFSTTNWRYIAQMADMVWFSEETMLLEFRRNLRDHIHFIPKVYELAALAIGYLNLFKYASLHVRRNDLKLIDSGAMPSPQGILLNVAPLLEANETIFIATDEPDPAFFEAIKRHHRVFFFADFFGPDGIFSSWKVPRKLEGLVELVICAGARIFIGTRTSTFSSYITRIRGYIDAPDTNIYFTMIPYSNNAELNSWLALSKVRGRRFTVEYPVLWESIRNLR